MEDRFPHPIRCIGLTITLLLALILIGCGRAAGPGPEPIEPASSLTGGPPQSTLSFNKKTQSGEIGSFCWNRGCADMAGIPVPIDPLTVPAGARVVFEFSGSEPLTDINAAARPLRGRLIDGAGMKLLQSSDEAIALPALSSGNRTEIRANLEPGEYSMTVSIQTSDRDALYGFHVVIQ